MATTCMNFTFKSEIAKIREILCNVLSCVENQIPFITESDLFDLRLVYSELLANAVVHGNKDDSTKNIELSIVINQNELFSVIRDEGEGFDYDKVINKKNSYENLFKTNGRGLQLVRSLTEDLNFNTSGNVIEFHKKLTDS